MEVTIVFYGGLKQVTGVNRQTVVLPGESVALGTLLETLTAQFPALAERLPTVAYAVDNTLVGRDYVLRDGDEAALLPPVSGG